ncbi:hypothetical protein Tb927.6.810 [Trypanosoma brucei brucei TREU927]|uniref:Uncharacterized protein n=1 Tax=Trypanosoma brucei brucei (strain 927/4 GUTat10.1) TaxID=185431 RepID=Q583S2_TRYB2|nr:hypothetical protein Tb927.6.810 [Trypanosoma brucei brucei TREU927]AAX80485.1 hypothetical protein Tb927.6.810 [Trypanosoma brucei]AAZ11645.1 hypothetical protein Tb927.6.810 [Trypanosoma brucei brucei TREU927]
MGHPIHFTFKGATSIHKYIMTDIYSHEGTELGFRQPRLWRCGTDEFSCRGGVDGNPIQFPRVNIRQYASKRVRCGGRREPGFPRYRGEAKVHQKRHAFPRDTGVPVPTHPTNTHTLFKAKHFGYLKALAEHDSRHHDSWRHTSPFSVSTASHLCKRETKKMWVCLCSIEKLKEIRQPSTHTHTHLQHPSSQKMGEAGTTAATQSNQQQ